MLIICILTGIADSGSGVGILVFAPLTTVLLDAYGWKGTHLVFGGLSLGSVLFASLMGPIGTKCQPYYLKEENNQVQIQMCCFFRNYFGQVKIFGQDQNH